MTVFLINAFAMAFVANHWNRVGWLNLICRLIFVALAVVNAALAAPLVSQWVSP